MSFNDSAVKTELKEVLKHFGVVFLLNSDLPSIVRLIGFDGFRLTMSEKCLGLL